MNFRNDQRLIPFFFLEKTVHPNKREKQKDLSYVSENLLKVEEFLKNSKKIITNMRTEHIQVNEQMNSS